MQDQLGVSLESDGFPAGANSAQREMWANQELFLRAYAMCGKRTRSADSAGVSVEAVERWVSSDVYSFKKRMAASHARYVEKLEAEMDATIEAKPTNAAILQIFRLKAEHPEKYREEVKVISNEAPALMWMRLRELAGDKGAVVEGEVTELNSGDSDTV